jgi:hypothetical protein
LSKRIINFSGGKSSALMTIIEYNPATDYVVFCDTGREHPKTYKFINDFEAYENIPIIRLGNKDSFTKYLAKNDFEEIPNIMKRSCTIELKVKVARRWARKNIGMAYDNLLGFRFDEPQRVIKNKKRWQQVNQVFPLFNKGITKENVNQYWLSKPYNLEIPSILGNCTLCFMKGKNNIINILRYDPSLADQWIEDERRSSLQYGHTYLKGISIEQCLKISQMNDLFTSVDIDNLTPAFNCSCTS